MVFLVLFVCGGVVCMLCGFFFRQKPAYEMRISDWSSDVCSSDLPVDVAIIGGGLAGLTQAIALASHGISVTVIDREDPVRALAAGFDGRVSAIALASQQIGRASCRDRVCQYV